MDEQQKQNFFPLFYSFPSICVLYVFNIMQSRMQNIYIAHILHMYVYFPRTKIKIFIIISLSIYQTAT